MGLHLSQGLESVFQTFGWTAPKYEKLISVAGKLVAGGIAVGFGVIAIVVSFLAE